MLKNAVVGANENIIDIALKITDINRILRQLHSNINGITLKTLNKVLTFISEHRPPDLERHMELLMKTALNKELDYIVEFLTKYQK